MIKKSTKNRIGYWRGKKRPPFSKEWRDKISKTLKGIKRKPHSEEHKRKISEANKGNTNVRGKHWKLSEKTKQRLSESHKGEKSHFWKGGISFEPYSVDWTETLKRSIRERDNYICQICSQYGSSVHHKDYDKKNCNPENLITLCNSCNSKVNFNRDYWINYFNFKEIKD